MKNHIRASLVVVSITFLVWGMGFVMFPQMMHEALSTGTYDPATASLFAATLVGLSLLFLISAQDPQRDVVYGLAATLAFLGIAAAIGMLPEGGLHSNASTLFSLVITVGVATYLFVVQSEAVTMNASGPARGSKKPAAKKKTTAKKKPAAKKKTTAKKKTKKKTARRR
jgi:lysylphosphatidylglycerol synthetase-like protein (DUF2156 family)